MLCSDRVGSAPVEYWLSCKSRFCQRKTAHMAIDTTYKFLEYRPGANYRQMFLKGRNLRAEVL